MVIKAIKAVILTDKYRPPSVKAPKEAALASSSVLSGRCSSQMLRAKELIVNKHS